MFASLAAWVVLPEPCKPAIRMTAGLALMLMSSAEEPIRAISSSYVTFTIIWLGETAFNTSMPNALAFTLSVNSLAIL